MSGDKAFINNEYQIEGDATIMLKFADMFAPPTKSTKKEKVNPVTYNYKEFEPKKIKNIVVFDGGYRSNKNSKTSFMVNHFIDGTKESTLDFFDEIYNPIRRGDMKNIIHIMNIEQPSFHHFVFQPVY